MTKLRNLLRNLLFLFLTLKSCPLQRVEGVPNHGQVSNRQEALGLVPCELVEPAAPSRGQNHGLELRDAAQAAVRPVSGTRHHCRRMGTLVASDTDRHP